ncbi:MAG TPA: MlaD family protein [Jatrophihabitantaceae bacterium]|nr:MlaD family protein [Jatrophihabitantaceae bacterium]
MSSAARKFVAPLIKLIIFLVITALATFILGETIANSSYGSTNTYKAAFSDVTGLQIGDDVRIAGVRVGTVQNIQIEKSKFKKSLNRGYALVSFTVEKSAKVATSAEVNLRYRNLVGQRYLDVEQGPGWTRNTPLLKPGKTICGSADPTNCANTHPAVDLTVLFGGFKDLIRGLDATQINQLSVALIETLQGEGGALQSLFATVADLTNTLADKDKVIGDVIDNLSSVLQAVGQRDNELSDLVVQLRNFMTGLASDRNTIGNAIDGVNRLAESTSGLLTQVRGPFAQDVESITQLSDSLNANASTITYVLRQLPPTVAGLIRTASYGSWFNFYLCSFSAILTLPGNHKTTFHNLAYGSSKRCNP